jgi:hypothetical protein
MSIHCIHVNSYHSCHVTLTFYTNSEKSGEGGWVKYVFPGLSFGDSFAVRPKAKIVPALLLGIDSTKEKTVVD